MRVPAARLPAVPDVLAAIEELDALLARETDAQAAHEVALAGVLRAQQALKDAEGGQSRAEGLDAIAAAIAAASAARDVLADAAREATNTRERVRDLAAQTKAAWRALSEQVQPALDEAEATAEQSFCAAAAELGRARIVLNEVRAAIGGPPILPLRIKAPRSDENAADVTSPVPPALPYLDDVARLRREIEDRRTMR